MPKKPEANCFVISVSLGCRPRRASISTACEPATSVRSDGILAMKTAAAWLFAPSKATVVKTIGTPLARQASISRRVAATTESRSEPSGEDGIREAVDEVDHEQGGPPAEAGGPAEPALAVEGGVVLHQSPAAAAASASRTRSSASSPGSSGDQRSGVRRRRRLEAGLGPAVGERLLERRAEVERQRVAALRRAGGCARPRSRPRRRCRRRSSTTP